MKVKISADGTIDMPQELAERYDISFSPAHVLLDENIYDDGVNITPEQLFSHVDAGGKSATCATNIAEYEDYFNDLLTRYDAVVHHCQSAKLSANFQNATLAAEGKPVYVVDFRAISSAGSLVTAESARLAESGIAPEEIARIAGENALKIDTSFVLSTLKYMARGGRCSTVQALGANLLKLKPCIEVNTAEGTMDVGKKYRGTLDAALAQYVDDRLKDRTDLDTSRPIYVTCSARTPDETVEMVKKRVAELATFAETFSPVAGCSISNHCGPATLGLLFFTK
ncbi:MAG: DegV family EDD domain-containing protein [Oscillospiraceae bacterium]|jgi:DegV family protein with EDD domain|nr:DegV family EDD domain-containing protein [Oscillospiraceae bacterium]